MKRILIIASIAGLIVFGLYCKDRIRMSPVTPAKKIEVAAIVATPTPDPGKRLSATLRRVMGIDQEPAQSSPPPEKSD